MDPTLRSRLAALALRYLGIPYPQSDTKGAVAPLVTEIDDQGYRPVHTTPLYLLCSILLIPLLLDLLLPDLGSPDLPCTPSRDIPLRQRRISVVEHNCIVLTFSPLTMIITSSMLLL